MEKTQNTDVLAIRPEEAFRRLGISRATGYKFIADGTIPAVRLGPKRILVPIVELEKLLKVVGV